MFRKGKSKKRPTPSTSNSSITDEARQRLEKEDQERDREKQESEAKRKCSGERRTVSEEVEGVQGAVGGFPEELIPASSLSAPTVMEGTGEGPGKGFAEEYEQQFFVKARKKYAGHTPPTTAGRVISNLSGSGHVLLSSATPTNPLAYRNSLSTGSPIRIIQSPRTVSSNQSSACGGDLESLNISDHPENKQERKSSGPFKQLIKRFSGHDEKQEDAIRPSTSGTYRKVPPSPQSALVHLANLEAAAGQATPAQDDLKGKKGKEKSSKLFGWLKKKDKRGDESDSHSDESLEKYGKGGGPGLAD